MRIAFPLVCLLLSATLSSAAQDTAPFPAGWTGIFDRGSHCLIAVPPSWKVDDGRDASSPIATAPGARATAMLNWTPATDFVRRMKALLAPTMIVHEDSTRRFWAEYARKLSGRHHLIAMPAAGGYCAVYLDLAADADGALTGTAMQIVETIGPAR